jgi:hypothetical protein
MKTYTTKAPSSKLIDEIMKDPIKSKELVNAIVASKNGETISIDFRGKVHKFKT